jgi:hypothetical protein
MFKLKKLPVETAFSGNEARFFIVIVAAALAVWLFASAGYRRAAIGEIGERMITINSYKSAQVRNWLGEHNREALRQSRNTFVGEMILAERAEPGKRRTQLLNWLKEETAQNRYAGAAFLSLEGAVLAATPGYSPGLKKHSPKQLTGPRGEHRPSPTFTSPPTASPGWLYLYLFHRKGMGSLFACWRNL